MDFPEIGGISLGVAFLAGLLSCASPCVLPLIPAYLGYLTGASLEPASAAAPAIVGDRASGGTAVTIGGAPTTTAPSPFLHSLSFVAGFALVFVSFGVSLGLAGYFLKDHQGLILKASGTLLIILGLHLSGVITIP